MEDARNTDNAWFETRVLHFHDAKDLVFNTLEMVPSDPNLKFVWFEVKSDLPVRSAHRRYIDMVCEYNLCAFES